MKRNIATLFLSIVALVSYGVFVVYAAAPTGGYNPGTVLDPDCAPGDVDCIVKLPTPISGDWVKTVNGEAHDIAGNVLLTTDNISDTGNANQYFRGVQTLDALVGNGTSSSPLGLAFLFENSVKGTVSLGTGATSDSSHSNSIFIGLDAGNGSSGINGSAFIGTNSGANTSASYANFMGINSGADAVNANNSNFFGFNSGASATRASDSSFFGNSAGYGATDAYNSNFFGKNAGYKAIDARCSNFFGNEAGYQANNAYCSNFVGYQAGKNATNASRSNFMGTNAGENATYAAFSNFIGHEAGYGASSLLGTTTKNANFLGYQAGYQATDAENSSFIGYQAGYQATNADNSNFMGSQAGMNAVEAFGSNFFGFEAGLGSTYASVSNFIGVGAGKNVGLTPISGTDSEFASNFIGYESGGNAVNAYSSNFMGYQAGKGLVSASASNIFGYQAGLGSTGPLQQANIIGYQAGTNISFTSGSTPATSDFIGYQAGRGSSNLYNSSIIGYQAGMGAIAISNPITTGTDAHEANFKFGNTTIIGYQAALNAKDVGNSFIGGYQAGMNATSIPMTVMIGYQAGLKVQSAQRSIFIGYKAGTSLSDPIDSIFIGSDAGASSQYMKNAVAIGDSAGRNFIDGSSNNGGCGAFTPYCGAVIIGHNAGSAGKSSYNYVSNNPVMIGSGAGFYNQGVNGVLIGARAGNGYIGNGNLGADAGTGAFIGSQAGEFFNIDPVYKKRFTGPTYVNPAQDSTLIGTMSGWSVTSGTRVTGIGQQSLMFSDKVTDVIAIGLRAGASISNVNNSIFLGRESGQRAETASRSIFIGTHAGGVEYSRTMAENLVSSIFTKASTVSSTNPLLQNPDLIYDIRGAINARNSIFIGDLAGAGDWVDNTYVSTLSNSNDYSMLLGPQTSTGSTSSTNNKNSIALGAYATNTAQNQLMIGSTQRRIEEVVFNGGTGNTCTIVPGTGITCSSDIRLKNKISDLSSTTLQDIMHIDTMKFTWKDGINTTPQIGFVAQNINQYFPELVTTNRDGMLSVNYAGMTPVLVKAIQELNFKMDDFTNSQNENSLRARLIAWFADIGNGIGDFFVGRIRTNEICIADGSGETCLNRSQVDDLLSGNTSVVTPTEPTVNEPETPIDDTEPTVEQPAVDVPPVDENPPVEELSTEPTVDEPETPTEVAPTEQPSVDVPSAGENPPQVPSQETTTTPPQV